MAAILTIFAGALGLLAALAALVLGSSVPAAFALWMLTGMTASVIGLAWSYIPQHVHAGA